MACTVDGCQGEVTTNEGGTKLHHVSGPDGKPWPIHVRHAAKVTREDLERHLGADRVALLTADQLHRMTGPHRMHQHL